MKGAVNGKGETDSGEYVLGELVEKGALREKKL